MAQPHPRLWPDAEAGVQPQPAPTDELGMLLLDLVAQHQAREPWRASMAATSGEALVAELVDAAPTRSDHDLEDELCRRFGSYLRVDVDGSNEDRLGADRLAEALLTAAVTAVRVGLAAPDGWQAPWRVLSTVARVLPRELTETLTEAVGDLRRLPGGQVLPLMIAGPALASQVWWSRDVYGSRFGVTAAFSTANGPKRWFLWDIDACAHEAITVHSGYYDSSAEALAAWQAGVGATAAGESVLVPVDDVRLLAQLLPHHVGVVSSGGRDESVYTEFHRCRRLRKVVLDAVGWGEDAERDVLDVATATEQFTAWLRVHRAGQPEPADLGELIEELADSWCFSDPAALRRTCSPHRVALMVLHLHNFYLEEFVGEMLALLPDWVAWLAETNGTPAELVERCRPYLLGETHRDVGADNSNPNYLARVHE